jgi:hypothetical protein
VIFCWWFLFFIFFSVWGASPCTRQCGLFQKTTQTPIAMLDIPFIFLISNNVFDFFPENMLECCIGIQNSKICPHGLYLSNCPTMPWNWPEWLSRESRAQIEPLRSKFTTPSSNCQRVRIKLGSCPQLVHSKEGYSPLGQGYIKCHHFCNKLIF